MTIRAVRRTFAEHRLGRMPIQIASFTSLYSLRQFRQSGTCREERGGAERYRRGWVTGVHFRYSRRNSVFASVSTRLRSAESFLPARLM